MPTHDIAYVALCEICNEPFGVRRNSVARGKPSRFCSRACYYVWHRRGKIAAPCDHCGTISWLSVSLATRVDSHFCSYRCRALGMQMTIADHIATGLLHEDFERVPGLGPCWTWKGSKNSTTGYGVIRQRRDGRRSALDVHRAAWEVASGAPIPDGLRVLHICDVRPCGRADDEGVYDVRGILLPRRGHLFLGTQADNMADAAQKGRTALGDRNGSRKHLLAKVQ